MREVDNLEASLGAGLSMTAYGLMGAASALGDAIGGAVRRAAYLKRVDALTRVAVRQHLAAKRTRAAHQAEAAEILREFVIHRHNARLLAKAA